KLERMQWKMERMKNRMERRGFPFGPPSSGNRAFDEYRTETLRRLEEEQKEFKEFLARLRQAKDKEEFDAFVAHHLNRPTPRKNQPPQSRRLFEVSPSGIMPPASLTANTARLRKQA